MNFSQHQGTKYPLCDPSSGVILGVGKSQGGIRWHTIRVSACSGCVEALKSPFILHGIHSTFHSKLRTEIRERLSDRSTPCNQYERRVHGCPLYKEHVLRSSTRWGKSLREFPLHRRSSHRQKSKVRTVSMWVVKQPFRIRACVHPSKSLIRPLYVPLFIFSTFLVLFIYLMLVCCQLCCQLVTANTSIHKGQCLHKKKAKDNNKYNARHTLQYLMRT